MKRAVKAGSGSNMRLVGGRYYLNGRGDLHGPMDEFASGVWTDQYATWFAPDGRQVSHAYGSTGNLVTEACPWCRKAEGGMSRDV